MYPLGDNFKVDYEKSIANPECVIQGEKYRFTIITDGLFRFEYNENGQFNDKPTSTVLYRNFDKPQYEVKQDENSLFILTKYAAINYKKNKPFRGSSFNPKSNFEVKLLNTDRSWYYGHPEVKNVGAPEYEISYKKAKRVSKLDDIVLGKGLFSFDGFVTLDDSNSRIIGEDGTFINNPNKGIDIYLFVYFNDFEKCVKEYFSITGYPGLIPRYCLGNWWNKNDCYNDTSLKELTNDFTTNQIPISVLLLNKSWHTKADEKRDISSGFTFNKERFSSPYDMVSYLHSIGIRLGLDINPLDGLYPNDEYYGKACEYLGKGKDDVVPFNVLDPKTIDVYLKLYIHPLDALGIDFYNIDYNNKSRLDDISILKHYHLLDMARDYKRRSFVMGHNGLMAPHRYTVLTSPKAIVDWNTLKLYSLYNILSPNMGIIWWSHDIGGYCKGIEDTELFTRFVQLGVFSPILRLSSETGKYYKREPWKWSLKTFGITKEFLTLRHKLIPYLYSESYKYSKKGDLLIKPIYYKYHELYDDELYYNEYYLGSELFVAPIIKKKDFVMNRTIHKFFIPDGIWYDFFSGKKFPGPNNYVSFYREQDYPVFAKAGSIIVMGANPNINDTNPPMDMEIHIFPGRSNTYELYEDDGISDLYKKSFFLLTSIDYNYMPNNYTVIIRSIDGKSGIVPATRNYKLIFRNTKKAQDIIVYSNDVKINYNSYVKGPDFIVEIKNARTIGQITINCKGKDIEIDAVRLINKDIEQIISDLQIDTEMKEKIDNIIFGDLSISKKRIGIRKLGRRGLESKFVKLFLKLLEYVKQV